MGLHHNVYASYAYQLAFNTAISIAVGPLFDVYLFKLGEGSGEGNTLVGAVESVSGLVSLGLVIPVGWLVDKYSRLMLLRVSAVVGIFSSIAGAVAITYNSIPIWYVTMAVNGLYTSLSGSASMALFADSVKSEDRMKATTTLAIFMNVATSTGPALSLIAFMFIGDNWEINQLRMILMAGMVIFNPIACISLLCFKPAPFQDTGETDGPEEVDENMGKFSKIRGAKIVPFITASSDLICMIGAGMTIKYFNLYWKNDYKMSPAQVLAISVVQPLSIAFFIRILEMPAKMMGRAQASLMCFSMSVLAMIVLAEVDNVYIALAAYFIRAGLANASSPYNKSIVYDFTPSAQRGRWNAVETLCGSVWSGSAFLGGYMADHYDYRFTFLVTAGVYAFSSCIFSPLLCIVPRQMKEDEKDVSLLDAYGTPTREKGNKGPALGLTPYTSPGHALRLRSGSEL